MAKKKEVGSVNVFGLIVERKKVDKGWVDCRRKYIKFNKSFDEAVQTLQKIASEKV